MEQPVRYFQFLAGPRNGEVVVFDKIEEEDGIVFVCFKDGSRCNEQLILPLNSHDYQSQLMAEVDSPSNVWVIETTWVGREEEKWEMGGDGVLHCVQPLIEGKKKIIPHPPRKTTSKFGQINTFNTPATPANATSNNDMKTQQQAPGTSQPSNSGDPVWLMCEKAKKFDTAVKMSMIISLPTQSLYNVVKESFENGGPKVIEYIIQNLDNQVIKESLKQALLMAYEPIIPNNEVPYEVEAPIVGSPEAQGEIIEEEEK